MILRTCPSLDKKKKKRKKAVGQAEEGCSQQLGIRRPGFVSCSATSQNFRQVTETCSVSTASFVESG